MNLNSLRKKLISFLKEPSIRRLFNKIKFHFRQLARHEKLNIKPSILVVVLISIGLWALWLGFRYDQLNLRPRFFLEHILISIGPEVSGIALGVLTVDYLSRKRQENECEKQLIRKLGSQYADVADTAARELAHIRYWRTGVRLKEYESYSTSVPGAIREAFIRNATLINANLWGAHLTFTYLAGSNLRGANLVVASLQGANLSRSDLRDAYFMEADLTDANLQDSNLKEANMSGADLRNSNLTGSDLRNVNFSGADLRQAGLEGANLKGAIITPQQLRLANLCSETILPCGNNFTGI